MPPSSVSFPLETLGKEKWVVQTVVIPLAKTVDLILREWKKTLLSE